MSEKDADCLNQQSTTQRYSTIPKKYAHLRGWNLRIWAFFLRKLLKPINRLLNSWQLIFCQLIIAALAPSVEVLNVFTLEK